MNIVITILIIIVLLGILVGLHELGHLMVAKAFNVYCLEYSIGFGPKIFSRRYKGGETFYSLRAIPFGGYVSMYGEGVELPDGVTVPKERSLEGLSHPKQALVMGAGIMVNFFLSVLFCFIYATCFPSNVSFGAFATGIDASGNEVASGSLNAYYLYADGDIGGEELLDSEFLYSPIGYTHVDVEGGTSIERAYFLLDGEATVNGEPYVAMYRVASTAYANDVFANLFFYEADPNFFPTAGEIAIGLISRPLSLSSPLALNEGDEIILHLTTVEQTDGDFAIGADRAIAGSYRDGAISFEGSTLSNYIASRWRSFPEAMSLFCQQFVSFFEMIGLGLAKLFTFDLKALGSVVMMGSQVNVLTQSIGIGQAFFWYGSALSLNLAIFNLIPIPGLDGWQLLVTTYEGATKKKIPDKVKSIVSFIGLGLLLVLAAGLIVKDILSVTGII